MLRTKKRLIAVLAAAVLAGGVATYGLVAVAEGAVAGPPSGSAAAQTTGPDGAVLAGDQQTQPAGLAQQAGENQQLRDQVLEMLKDHMGITGTQAQQWADTMVERCEQYWGRNETPGTGTPGAPAAPATPGGGTYGPGMMNGRGMMNFY